jgi:ABC-type multidrug transport system ATPase subunit
MTLSPLGGLKIVIRGEPTAGVDVQARQLIWKAIAKLKGTMTIVMSHALEEAEAVSSRFFVVAWGRIPFAGTSTELTNEFEGGYVLRVEGNVEAVLELAQQFVPESKMQVGRPDTIEMPVCKSVPAFIRELEERKEELAVVSLGFAVEQLEDVWLKLIESEEAHYQRHRSSD